LIQSYSSLIVLVIYCHQMGNSVTQSFQMFCVGITANFVLMVIRYHNTKIIFEMLLTFLIPLVAVIGLMVIELITNKCRDKVVEDVVTEEKKL